MEGIQKRRPVIHANTATGTCNGTGLIARTGNKALPKTKANSLAPSHPPGAGMKQGISPRLTGWVQKVQRLRTKAL